MDNPQKLIDHINSMGICSTHIGSKRVTSPSIYKGVRKYSTLPPKKDTSRPIVHYENADTQKAAILSDNTNKSGVYL